MDAVSEAVYAPFFHAGQRMLAFIGNLDRS
jgi:hypothetical protein